MSYTAQVFEMATLGGYTYSHTKGGVVWCFKFANTRNAMKRIIYRINEADSFSLNQNGTRGRPEGGRPSQPEALRWIAVRGKRLRER